MINFIKGFICGIGNIVPGLSGSAFLISFNLYDKSLEAISNIFNNFKKSFLFLLPITLGIILGTISFSNIIYYAITNYLTITSLIFAFFVFGTIPSLIKKACKYEVKLSYFISFFITFILGIILSFFKSNSIIYTLDYNLYTVIKLFISGIIVSISTIIPGISSTVLLTIIGMYGIYITSINTLNIKFLLPIGLGFIICSYFLSKIINYLIHNYYGYTYFGILGFVLSTIPCLFINKLTLSSDLLIGIILGLVAFFITSYSLRNIN